MIPKIIHYCWLSDDPMPRASKRYIKGWKKKLPDYEFVLWDRKRFDLDSTLWTRQSYDAKKYAFAADYIRLYALYHYGGIYMDTDVEVVKSFDPLLNRAFILGYEDIEKKGIEAGIMGSEKGLDWVWDCLLYYEKRKFIKDDLTFDMRSLPYIMRRIFDEKYSDYLNDIYSFDFFTVKSWSTREMTKTANTFTIHHFFNSWWPKKRRIKNKIKDILGTRITRVLTSILVEFRTFHGK